MAPRARIPGAPPPEPWKPPEWEPADAGAIQALARGDASPDLQRRALDLMINKLCGTYDMSYRPGADGDRDTAFAEGRRFAGLQLVKLLKLSLSALGVKGSSKEQG